jgi:hypothetical protein
MGRIALIAAFVLSSGVAQAQMGPPGGFGGSRGSPADQQACRGDARKLCRDVLSSGDFAVLQCLQANRGKVSRRCRAVLASHGQ